MEVLVFKIVYRLTVIFLVHEFVAQSAGDLDSSPRLYHFCYQCKDTTDTGCDENNKL